jgi:diguanylate cyclase (GGDEF)-like protein
LFVGLWAFRTKRSQMHFRRLARVDGLTGIWNRPYFVEQAEKTLEYCRKMEQAASIILCDLDQFKAINDRCGHATGDVVLERTALACQACLRKSDLFGRFGGEEFAIVLPGCDLEQAHQLAEQLRMAIAAITVVRGVHKTSVSASFGVAASGDSGYELQQLLAHADDALYQAKRDGRNRVVLHGGPEEDLGAVNDPMPPPDRRTAAS